MQFSEIAGASAAAMLALTCFGLAEPGMTDVTASLEMIYLKEAAVIDSPSSLKISFTALAISTCSSSQFFLIFFGQTPRQSFSGNVMLFVQLPIRAPELKGLLAIIPTLCFFARGN